MELIARLIVMLISLSTLTGCASVFNVQVLYEAQQPGTDDSHYVMRLEKEQNPLTGAGEEFSARNYNISEARVREMMQMMYRRFFKDPATFVPPDTTLGGAMVGAVVESSLNSLLDGRENKKKKPSSYRPKLNENGHPASMSEPKTIFKPDEIKALVPEVVRAFSELRKGEHLTLRTRALDSQGKGGAKWNESKDVTSVAIRFSPPGEFLGVEHGAEISWDFYKVNGLDFSGKANKKYTYTSRDKGFPEEYDFLAIFPREEGNTDYWRVKFSID